MNFVITSSLKDQCLNIFLKKERPYTEEKRLNFIKMQGEFLVKLMELEHKILAAFNNVQGSILHS